MDDRELLWEKYKQDMETHRGYLELAIRMNAFFYAITGAILSFYFLNVNEKPLVEYSLLLPCAMSLGFLIFFFRSAFAARVSHNEFMKLAEVLGFETYTAVAAVLEFMLWIFCVLAVIVFIGTGYLFFHEPVSSLLKCLIAP